MIFKLKTTKETNDIMNLMKKQLGISNNVIARIGIALSLKNSTLSVDEINEEIKLYDNLGFEFPRHVLYGENEIMYKILIEKKINKKISDKEFFPEYTKYHIENGIKLLFLEYKNTKNFEKLIKQLIRGV